jgi:hypothetical protein
MIYREPCFLAVVRFGSSPTPFPSARCLSSSVFLCVAGRAYWRKKGVREDPKHTTAAGEPGPLQIIQYSLQRCRVGGGGGGTYEYLVY